MLKKAISNRRIKIDSFSPTYKYCLKQKPLQNKAQNVTISFNLA